MLVMHGVLLSLLRIRRHVKNVGTEELLNAWNDKDKRRCTAMPCGCCSCKCTMKHMAISRVIVLAYASLRSKDEGGPSGQRQPA